MPEREGVCYAPSSISICERTSATPFIPVVSSCTASGRIAGREILGGDLRHDRLAKTEVGGRMDEEDGG
jgi:hypothetical protein